ncbi:MAG: Lrp/AsnC family transcriptional regulator [Candidatus Bathyarchaeota archaeon]|nr:Lrp/AsnC family transcriptional regulator [Candidatus Bathyarchaeota archaeon]MDH5745797.1 Lrp/AsnC family transcriptional regulator [Candidatus Bathyarchaeota archaeon]
MKNIRPKLIRLFKVGYCTPQIARIAKTINEPSATLHYNIKKLENEGAIKTYKAVFDYEKIDEGFCVYLFIKLTAKAGADPDQIVGELARYEKVDSADIIAGEWDVVLKVRTKNQDEYYDVLKSILTREGIEKSTSVISLKQAKTEFVLL